MNQQTDPVTSIQQAAQARRHAARQELASRIRRLENFLSEDPHNPALAAELFEAALAAGDHQCAEAALANLRTSGDPAACRFREASLRIAQQRYEEADALLQGLAAAPDAQPAIIHNRAHIAYCGKRYADCLALLEPLAGQAESATGVQMLWLRSLHHLGKLDSAIAWCEPRIRSGRLTSGAAGVASLLYLDTGRLDQALRLAEAALRDHPRQIEALVAHASLALGRRDPETAISLLERALQENPNDGRAWSALAFSHLLLQHPDTAHRCFEQALTDMPLHIGTWHGLGWCRILAKDLAGARKAFEQALTLDRNFGESHGGLAVVHALAGERNAAETAIEIALRLDQNGLSARYAKSVLDGIATDARAMHRLAAQLLEKRGLRLLMEREFPDVTSSSRPPKECFGSN